MSTFGPGGRLLRLGKPAYVAQPEWPGIGRRRVLVENPDRAGLWGRAACLRDAGYDVATCAGPTARSERGPWRWRPEWPDTAARGGQKATLCPLLAEGYCSLVAGADVVVSTTRLVDGAAIHVALAATASNLVVEATAPELERDQKLYPDALVVTEPVTPAELVAAVDEAVRGVASRARDIR